jgi:hypothetical protein
LSESVITLQHCRAVHLFRRWIWFLEIHLKEYSLVVNRTNISAQSRLMGTSLNRR